MAKKKSKDLAQRIDPTYHRRRHPLRTLRAQLSLWIVLAAVVYAGSSRLPGRKRIFANGPVAASHRFIESQCTECHTLKFDSVADSACLQCHDAGPHLPQDSARVEPSCNACHREHRGDTLLSAVTDRHCNRCHEAHRSITSLGDHIQFERAPKEQYLAFDHVKHLDHDLVGGSLTCGSCHQPQPDGSDFAPISFDRHCARCHKERLGPGADDIVPHGVQPQRLKDWVAAAILRRAREQGEIAPRGPSAVPGRGASRVPDWADALAERTDRAMEALFQRGRGCLYCHVAEEGAIRPPEIPTNWFPRAYYNHKTHRFASCDQCHDMGGNTSAGILEVPGVETCRKCHSRDGANDSCTTCHPYHPPDVTAWR